MIIPLTNKLEYRPKFIVVEGINGSGKSSLIKKLDALFSALHIPFILTKEPGGTELGLEIRRILLDRPHPINNPITELLLFSADRSEHVDSVIKPAIKDNKVVVCDRYIFSTLAFQGYGHKLSLDTLEALNSIATGGLLPDLVILLDLTPEEGLKRNHSANKTHDEFENYDIAFHERVRNGFRLLAASSIVPFIILDATAPITEVHSIAVNFLKKCYE